MLIMVSPLHLILCGSPYALLCRANKHLNCRLVTPLEPNMCVLGFRFRLI
jgi:hypothetical protein